MSTNKWQLTRNAKDELVKLAMATASAHGAVLRATKNQKFSVKPEELAKLNQAENETMESLKAAVAPLGLEAVKELAGWIQYKAVHDPVEPVGQGKSTWNKKTAGSLSGALWSLVNALKAVHGKEDERVRQMSNRANSTGDFVRMYNELDGLYPRDGMTSESRDFGLRKLDELFHKTKAKGDAKRAEYLNTLYARAAKSLAFLKPKQSVRQQELPAGITVNADPNAGIATMGEALAPVGESAPAPETAPVSVPAQSASEQLRDKAFGAKKVGAAPFKSARPKKS